MTAERIHREHRVARGEDQPAVSQKTPAASYRLSTEGLVAKPSLIGIRSARPGSPGRADSRMSAIRIHDTARQLRDSYGYPPVPLAFEHVRVPLTIRQDIALTAPPLRRPVTNRLMHVELEGDCLTPYIPAGRTTVTFDAGLPARDFDYVLLEASAEMRDLLHFWAEHDPAWSAKYRDSGVPDVWTKQIRLLDDGAAWFVERVSAMPLRDCQILGTLVGHRSLVCV